MKSLRTSVSQYYCWKLKLYKAYRQCPDLFTELIPFQCQDKTASFKCNLRVGYVVQLKGLHVLFLSQVFLVWFKGQAANFRGLTNSLASFILAPHASTYTNVHSSKASAQTISIHHGVISCECAGTCMSAPSVLPPPRVLCATQKGGTGITEPHRQGIPYHSP